jgi:hypothetical protein
MKLFQLKSKKAFYPTKIIKSTKPFALERKNVLFDLRRKVKLIIMYYKTILFSAATQSW